MTDKKDYLKLILISAVVAIVVSVVMNGTGLTGAAVSGQSVDTTDETESNRDNLKILEGKDSDSESSNEDAFWQRLTELITEILNEVKEQGKQIDDIKVKVDWFSTGHLDKNYYLCGCDCAPLPSGMGATVSVEVSGDGAPNCQSACDWICKKNGHENGASYAVSMGKSSQLTSPTYAKK